MNKANAEAKKLIQETIESPEFFGQGIQLLSMVVPKKDTYKGTFRARATRKVFEYEISGGSVKYKPVGVRQDSAEVEQVQQWQQASQAVLVQRGLTPAMTSRFDSQPANFTV